MQSRSQAPEVVNLPGREMATRWAWDWGFADDSAGGTPEAGPMREVATRWDWDWEFAGGEVAGAA